MKWTPGIYGCGSQNQRVIATTMVHGHGRPLFWIWTNAFAVEDDLDGEENGTEKQNISPSFLRFEKKKDCCVWMHNLVSSRFWPSRSSFKFFACFILLFVLFNFIYFYCCNSEISTSTKRALCRNGYWFKRAIRFFFGACRQKHWVHIRCLVQMLASGCRWWWVQLPLSVAVTLPAFTRWVHPICIVCALGRLALQNYYSFELNMCARGRAATLLNRAMLCTKMARENGNNNKYKSNQRPKTGDHVYYIRINTLHTRAYVVETSATKQTHRMCEYEGTKYYLLS